MARIRLGRREVKDYDLPLVCAKCGVTAVERTKKKFSWHPQWVIILILVNLIVYAIVALAMTKRMTVPLPFCENHRNYWRNRLIYIYGGFFGLIFLGIAGGFAAASLNQGGQNDVLPIFWVGFALTFLVWLISAGILQATSIRPNEITDGSITLIGLSEAFVDAIQEERDADEEAYRARRDRLREHEDRPRLERGAPQRDEGYYEGRKERRDGIREDDRDER